MKAMPARTSAHLPPRVAILGFARSGRALAGALAQRGVQVAVGDDKPEDRIDGWRELDGHGVRFFLGGPREEALEGAGWLALSPGVPTTHPVVRAARARGLPVLSELEVAWRIAQEEADGKNRWIAVTGTNGKSTTTAWIADILRRGGRPVALAGNIGAPLSGFLAESAPRDFVCEVSSFQLETIERFRPDVAVLTNVTPDHLDRYESFEDYAAAKERIFSNQGPGDFAVVNADDPRVREAPSRARRVPFSRRGRAAGGAWAEGGRIVSEAGGTRREVLAIARLSLPGTHNVENALAAVAAAECLATPLEAIEKGLTEFRGLPHRTELVVEKDGVRWINDSKGTNVDATAKSLEGYSARSVILILGGRDKHGDFGRLAEPISRAARVVLTIGEAAGKIETALAGAAPIEGCGTMERAVRRAGEMARAGETVLLSPACASFDQYGNFEERGAHFAELVRRAVGAGSDPLRGSDPQNGS